MLPIPSALRIEFEACTHSLGVPKAEQFAHEKWLRFYLDFCVKYHLPDEYRECPAPFLRKLEGEKQTKAQQQQASRAITLYFDLLESKDMQTDGRSPQMVTLRTTLHVSRLIAPFRPSTRTKPLKRNQPLRQKLRGIVSWLLLTCRRAKQSH